MTKQANHPLRLAIEQQLLKYGKVENASEDIIHEYKIEKTIWDVIFRKIPKICIQEIFNGSISFIVISSNADPRKALFIYIISVNRISLLEGYSVTFNTLILPKYGLPPIVVINRVTRADDGTFIFLSHKVFEAVTSNITFFRMALTN